MSQDPSTMALDDVTIAARAPVVHPTPGTTPGVCPDCGLVLVNVPGYLAGRRDLLRHARTAVDAHRAAAHQGTS